VAAAVNEEVKKKTPVGQSQRNDLPKECIETRERGREKEREREREGTPYHVE